MIDYSPMSARIWARLGSCGAFGLAAMELPEVDDRVVVLTSDLCTFSGLDRFKSKFPNRLYNLGIAEQNMIGVAGGFAKEGFIPFATTYGVFASMRCADQVKVTMGYMGLPIKLVGLTSGFAVSALGATHMSLEDVAVMRALPNVTIIEPADCAAVVKAVIAVAKYPGPVYLRLTGPMPNAMVYQGDLPFEIGKANVLRDGSDVSLVAAGNMVSQSLKAAAALEAEGVSVEVIDMHTIRPLDHAALAKLSERKLVVVVEEHARIGGLGSAILDEMAMWKSRPPVLVLGSSDGHYPLAGSYADMLNMCGLDAVGIRQKVLNAYKEIK